MKTKFTLFPNTFYRLRLSAYYREIVSQDLIYKQNYHNTMELPKIEKLVINSTSKSFVEDRKNIAKTLLGLEIICGQKCRVTTAHKSIAGFKIREGQTIGCKVTLRNHSLSGFLDRYIAVILPRFNDLAEKKELVDNHYTTGLTDLLLFPELENLFSLFENLRPLDLSFVMCKKRLIKIYCCLQLYNCQSRKSKKEKFYLPFKP